jgi:hypothetical protein
VYLLAGHIANEINELHRLAVITLDQTHDGPLSVIGVGRAWVIMRVLIGKTFEAFRFIEEHLREAGDFYQEYLKEPFGEPAKHPYLQKNEREAYAKVRKRMDAKRGLLAAIRNTYGFHYKIGSYLDDGFGALDDTWDLSMYSAGNERHHSRHASFHAASEHVIVRAMLLDAERTAKANAPAAVEKAPEEATDLAKIMNDLADETIGAAGEIADLMEVLMLCILKRHGKLLDGRGKPIKSMNDVPSIHKFRVPPILRT